MASDGAPLFYLAGVLFRLPVVVDGLDDRVGIEHTLMPMVGHWRSCGF